MKVYKVKCFECGFEMEIYETELKELKMVCPLCEQTLKLIPPDEVIIEMTKRYLQEFMKKVGIEMTLQMIETETDNSTKKLYKKVLKTVYGNKLIIKE